MGAGRACRGGPPPPPRRRRRRCCGGAAVPSDRRVVPFLLVLGGGGGPAAPSETASTSVTKTVNGSHHFKIAGYPLAKGIGVGKYIASECFTVGGYDWAIYFYPDGKSPEDGAAYVSLFIALASEGTDVRALFELTLVDQSGKGQGQGAHPLWEVARGRSIYPQVPGEHVGLQAFLQTVCLGNIRLS
ncbi:hypothetical protein EE612_041098 [Oryza sativa]|nr:hypothetical protein EE612_041098 [Oryza sativa]